MTPKRFDVKIVKMAKKIKAINYKGSVCGICGEDNIFKLCFHHTDPKEKEYQISPLIKNCCWSEIVKEIDKCELLCNNCHMELHNSFHEEHFDRNKKILLEFKGIKCNKCGYNNCDRALNFHHKNREDKTFLISKIRKTFRNISDLTTEIQDELNKCEILCSNCHVLEHSEIDFYKENEEKILDKVNTLSIYNKKIDKNLIKKLYFEDHMRQIDIVKLFNSNRSTISESIKQIKLQILTK